MTHEEATRGVLPEGRTWIGRQCHPDLVAWALRGPRLLDLRLETCLGSGVQSMVFRARLPQFPEYLTVKVYDKGRLHARPRQQLLRELRNHLDLAIPHRHILRAHMAFEDDRAVYLILQYAPHGDLFRQLHRTRPLREDEIVQWVIAPVLEAFSFLHGQGYIHRDLKPENLFIGPRFEVLLGDFGLSIDAQREIPTSRVGTAEYWAPEVLRRQPYTSAIDIWTVGILAYELLNGKTPFFRADSKAMERAILEEDAPPLAFVSAYAQDFVLQTLQRDPTRRPTAESLLRHPWIASVPSSRIGRPPRGVMRRKVDRSPERTSSTS